MDPYSVLGLNSNSSETDIKRKYKQLILKHHPDKGGDVKKFQTIQKAYESLINSQTKQTYHEFNSYKLSELYKFVNNSYSNDPYNITTHKFSGFTQNHSDVFHGVNLFSENDLYKFIKKD